MTARSLGTEIGSAPPALEASSLTKTYGGVLALEDVDFALTTGQIHAVVGENGAGKSTLIKCLSGAVTPDSGSVRINGSLVQGWSPTAALDAGVAVVHQELSLFPTLSVMENILGSRARKPWVNWRTMRIEAARILKSVGLDIDPRARIEQLSIGQQQMVEIARALSSGARVVILDEPTSSLSPHEVEMLFRFVHGQAEEGVAFVLITHFLEDVMAHANWVTVLRNGRLVRSVAKDSVTVRDLVDAMIGESSSVLQATYEGGRVSLSGRSTEPPVLELQGVNLLPAVIEMSLEVSSGEVLGVYGDLAAGHLEMAELVFGAGTRRPDAGVILVDGKQVDFRTTHRAREAGVGFIPADRRDALALEQPITWNATLAHLHLLTGFITRKQHELSHMDKWTDRLKIRGVTKHKTVGALSGGNQQKVLFARWLEFPPKVLVLVEPTRGMDIGAKSDVVRIVQEIAREGVAILVISTEPETILTFADRILVAHRGRIVTEFADVQVSKNELLAASHNDLERV